MHTHKLIKLSLITLTLLSLTACGNKEVVSVSVPTTTTETVETVKPAEPIVVSVEPINEVKEETEVEVNLPDPDLDYYGKVETEKTTYTAGLPTVKEDDTTASATPSAFPEDRLTPEAEALFGKLEHIDSFPEGGDW
ncbi:MAG: hypothetical protein IKR39_05380 [Lachnospiraceae bacterium]|nr:hypothetical protein [Lachnospiraceae bacterium]